MEPIIAGFKHVLTYFKLAGEKPGDPCLARIYYCLRSAGDKASASTLLYKLYEENLVLLTSGLYYLSRGPKTTP